MALTRAAAEPQQIDSAAPRAAKRGSTRMREAQYTLKEEQQDTAPTAPKAKRRARRPQSARDQCRDVPPEQASRQTDAQSGRRTAVSSRQRVLEMHAATVLKELYYIMAPTSKINDPDDKKVLRDGPQGLSARGEQWLKAFLDRSPANLHPVLLRRRSGQGILRRALELLAKLCCTTRREVGLRERSHRAARVAEASRERAIQTMLRTLQSIHQVADDSTLGTAGTDGESPARPPRRRKPEWDADPKPAKDLFSTVEPLFSARERDAIKRRRKPARTVEESLAQAEDDLLRLVASAHRLAKVEEGRSVSRLDSYAQDPLTGMHGNKGGTKDYTFTRLGDGMWAEKAVRSSFPEGNTGEALRMLDNLERVESEVARRWNLQKSADEPLARIFTSTEPSITPEVAQSVAAGQQEFMR
eukprot:scaffold3852_cov402-Prasinococcus_capsulatus_cf.AAC.3